MKVFSENDVNRDRGGRFADKGATMTATEADVALFQDGELDPEVWDKHVPPPAGSWFDIRVARYSGCPCYQDGCEKCRYRVFNKVNGLCECAKAGCDDCGGTLQRWCTCSATDGVSDCEVHRDSYELEVCPDCHGEGHGYQVNNWGGHIDSQYFEVPCSLCGQKGFLLSRVWTPEEQERRNAKSPAELGAERLREENDRRIDEWWAGVEKDFGPFPDFSDWQRTK